ncbi:uncharacterized protein LOC116929707 isoform X2 [Daphnia magna]|uniref:uncharacterized protein LOC116929707 isoform X2 n=1 Tax=Daphnia magna TaxID=35525 RepID=UPI0006E758BB|nr:uncharacterized protein LOC116929707 isoform X2 [Daphnia magna]
MAASVKLVGFCFICKAIYDKENQKVSTFCVNKTNLESWQQKVGGITVGDRLCETHFAPHDVIKGFFVLDYFCPYKMWRLAENAIPQYFLTSQKPKKRKALVDKMENLSGLKTKHIDAKVIPNQSPRLTTRPKQKTTKKPAEETIIINQDAASAASPHCIGSSTTFEADAVGGDLRMETTINMDSIISSSVQLDTDDIVFDPSLSLFCSSLSTSGVTVYSPSSSTTNNQSFEDVSALGIHRWNQDPVERFFGIVRSVNDTPTAHSWLQVFRILSLYQPTKRVVKNANIDEGEKGENMRILVQYKECLLKRFKDSTESAAQLRHSLREKMEKELVIRYVEKLEADPNCDTTENNLIYYMCGYLLNTRGWAIECEDCKSKMLTTEEYLPHQFEAADFTLSSTRGGLKLATPAMFQTFREVERIIRRHFQDGRHIYLRDSYELVISKICELNLIPVCCSNHPDSLPHLIMDYVLIRFHFESKRYRDLTLSKLKSNVHASKNKSTCVNTASLK